MKHALLITTLLLSVPAGAKTDVKGALEQLKTNEENAKSNFKQYDANAEIASQNIVEVTNAIKALREQRTQLGANAQNLEKNRAILDAVKLKLDGFKKEELAQMKREETLTAQLKAQLEKLEANKTKRQQNVDAYAQKMADVDKERADWDQQKQTFAGVQKEIDQKEQKALAEREKWLEKRKGYRGEATKWDKEAKTAEETRVKYDRLAD